MAESNIEDVLQVIEDCDLHKLRDMYRDIGPETDHIYNYLSSVVRWRIQHPDSTYFTILVLRSSLKTGTFIGINQYYCNELFMGSLEDNAESLYNAITKTRRIDWNGPWLVYSLYGKLYPTVLQALKKTSFEYANAGTANIWRAPKEKASNLIINWPPRYNDSHYYLATLIEMNGGCGIFLKSNNQLVAWAIQNTIGLGAIQTIESYLKKGYGATVTAFLSKKLAGDGFNPLGTVRQGNEPSERMFTKIGFEVAGTAVFINNRSMQESEDSAK